MADKCASLEPPLKGRLCELGAEVCGDAGVGFPSGGEAGFYVCPVIDWDLAVCIKFLAPCQFQPVPCRRRVVAGWRFKRCPEIIHHLDSLGRAHPVNCLHYRWHVLVSLAAHYIKNAIESAMDKMGNRGCS